MNRSAPSPASCPEPIRPLPRRAFLAAGFGFAAALPWAARAARPAAAPRSVARRAVVPAALTPYADDLQLDRADFRRHIADLAAVRGVTAIMVNGAAGHDSTLTRDERRALLAEALAAAGDRVAILAALREGAGLDSLAPLAADAAAEGAHGVVVMPPPAAATAWERAHVRVEQALSASGLPGVIYQTGYATDTLARLAALPGIVAVKEGSGSPAVFERNLRALRAAAPQVAVWSTHSSWLLADLALGADGILSGMGSVTADLHVALLDAVGGSDLAAARKISDRLFPLTQVFYRPGQDAHTRMKYALKRLGRQQRDLVRPPRRPLDDAERAAIDAALRAAGLLSA
jgi:4-hydroxy-tetrahydrodipicolinate synthase